MRPLSLDLRRRIMAAIDDGEPVAKVAVRFQVARQTVYDLIRARSQGALEPKRHPGNPTPKKLLPEAVDALRDWLGEKNDLTLKQLQARLLRELEITVSKTSIWTRLKKWNLTWKKNGTCRRTATPRRQSTTGSLARIAPDDPH